MAIYQPYFYIIQDIRNGMYYVGAKWAKDANPENFMVEGGYTTSSSVVNFIIEHYGISIFTIRVLRVFSTSYEAYRYETRFLRRVHAKTNPTFYNMHENDGRMELSKMRDAMVEKYGVENPMQSTAILEKRKRLSLKKCGVDHYSKTTQYREKYSGTCMSRFGVDHPFKSYIIQQKIVDTNLQKYGVPYHTQTQEHKQSIIDTCMEKYGVTNPYQADVVKEKIKQSNVAARGYECPTQSPDVKQKVKASVQERYGVINVSQTPEVKLKVKLKREMRLARTIIKQIKWFRETYRCELQKSWVFKSDEYLTELLDRLVKQYGPLPDGL